MNQGFQSHKDDAEGGDKTTQLTLSFVSFGNSTENNSVCISLNIKDVFQVIS